MSRSMLEVLQSISFRCKKMEPRQMDMHMTPFFVCFMGFELYSQFLTSCSISIQSVLGLLIQGNPRLPGWGGQACLPPHYFVSWGLCPWAHLSMGRLVLLCASITCRWFLPLIFWIEISWIVCVWYPVWVLVCLLNLDNVSWDWNIDSSGEWSEWTESLQNILKGIWFVYNYIHNLENAGTFWLP